MIMGAKLMNALFISYNLFCIDKRDGGRQVSFRNRNCFGNVIDGRLYTLFILFSEGSDTIKLEENEIALQGAKNKVLSLLNYIHGYAMITPQIEQYIIDFINNKEIDLVFFDSSIFGHTIREVTRRTTSKTICYMHNVEAIYSYNRVRNESKLYYPLYKAYRKNEKLAVEYSDFLISINERDARQTQELYGRFPDEIINVTFPDALDMNLIRQQKDIKNDKLKLLFIGSNFQPNVHGLKWFISEVLPELSATICVVGKGMENLKNELQGDNVQVIGSVEDLSDYYYKYDAIVLPIFYGSGMKVKTAEALMYGKVIFATNEALEGYETVEKSVYRCNTKEEFVSSITDYQRYGITPYSDQSRLIYLEKYSNESAEKKMKKIIKILFHE